MPGETDLFPVGATAPIPGLMVTDITFDTAQLSVEAPPTNMLSGLASKESMTGKLTLDGADEAASTDTWATAVTLTEPLVAVRM